MTQNKIKTRLSLFVLSGLIFTSPMIFPSAQAQDLSGQNRPSLIITSSPVPESLRNHLSGAPTIMNAPTTRETTNTGYTRTYEQAPAAAYARTQGTVATLSGGYDESHRYVPRPADVQHEVYTKPVEVREIKTHDVVGRSYYEPSETLVTKKAAQIESDLDKLRGKITGLSKELAKVERYNEDLAAEYYAAVATVNTQLQAGTTPGNPRLIKKMNTAEGHLEKLSGSMNQFNEIALETSKMASEAQFLLEETRAAYGIFGAVEEDHVLLEKTEDSINNVLVTVERVLSTVNDDLARTGAYISSERNNLRTLALSVTNGELYGKSLSNRPFSNVGRFSDSSADSESVSGQTVLSMSDSQSGDMPAASVGTVKSQQLASSGYGGEPRMLVKIKFDRPNVEYEQPVYVAVNEALERYPDARFDLVAVHPSQGNAAQVAIESTRARRNAERVLRVLTQMGLPSDRVDLSYDESAQAATSEVHLYIR